MVEFALRLPRKALAAADAKHERDTCLDHLLSSSIAPVGSWEYRSVAEWVEIARSSSPLRRTVVNRVLTRYGLAVVVKPSTVLRISNTDERLAALFAGTRWAHKRRCKWQPWVLALRQLEGAQVIGCHRFGPQASRATAIPLPLTIAAPAEELPARSSGS